MHRAKYADGATQVELGDRVSIRAWFTLWLTRMAGTVVYVPGASPFNANMEFNGLTWVGIRLDGGGGFVGEVVIPESGCLKTGVKFISRATQAVEALRPDEDPFQETKS